MEEAFKINQKSSKLRNDSAVQGTNDSSVLSKISTAELGYFKDDFLKYFAIKLARRSPLVNRGYYIRARLIDLLIKEFLTNVNKNEIKNQIINLGAGFDSTFFRLKDENLLTNTIFIEIDFPDVINRKINLIKQNQNLLNLCSDLKKLKDINGNSIYQSEISNYILIGLDMRNTKLLEAILRSISGFSESYPTFLLSEVVMTYMSVNSCNGVIKWISEMFTNCCVSVYEQISPFDAFGQVMCTHFQKLGSPLKCILRYPNEIEQINRYKKEGFSDVFTIKASEFYKNNITNEEKKRIDQIELFDEYEPWHMKCSHYISLSATKGEYCTQMIKSLYNEKKIMIENLNESSSVLRFESDLIKIRNFPIKFGIRFGHNVCSLGSKLFVFGGFGELATDTLGKHLRLPFIEVVDLNQMSLKVLEIESNPINDRIFLCSTTFDETSILISYGRSNPSKIFNSIIKLNYKEKTESDNNTQTSVSINESNLSFETLNLESDISRYRHSICKTNDSKLFIYGGKYYDKNLNTNLILNDAHLLDISNSKLTKINVDESICCARHSNSLCLWKNFIILTGGLSQNEIPLNDIILIDCNTFEFKKLTLNNGYVFPRYSHTSHVIDDHLILIGGANLEASPPGICFINLNKLTAYEFDLAAQEQETNSRLIYACHQTHVLNKNEILLIGGGAVCFTFGTHLNKKPVILDISNCWLKIDNN